MGRFCIWKKVGVYLGGVLFSYQRALRKHTFYRRYGSLLVLLVGLVGHRIIPVNAQSGAIYYVASNGNDNNSGTIEQPLQTIQKAIDMAQAGDTIYVRGGVYHQTVTITNSGQEGQPIRLLAYSDELPVLDGEYQLPAGTVDRCDNSVTPPRCFVSEPLVKIAGSYIEFAGFKLMRSQGVGISISGPSAIQQIVIRDCQIHETRNAAIRGLSINQLLVENCDIYHAGNYAPYDRPSEQLQWMPIVKAMDSANLVYRNNVIHENWGEGLAAGVNSQNVLMEDNVIFDNSAAQLYVNRASNVTIQRNLLYHTNAPELRRNGDPSHCLVLNNEDVQDGSIMVENIRILNNVIVGCSRNISIWSGKNSIFSLKDIEIMHNALVNAYSNTAGNAYGLTITNQANINNVHIHHNIISQNDGNVGSTPVTSTLVLDYNLWSHTPAAHMSGAGDIVADPQLANPNALLVPGAVQMDWYRPLASSPALQHNMGPFEVRQQPFTICCTLYLPLTLQK